MMGLLDVFNSEQGRMGLGLLGGGFGQQVRQGVASMDDFRKQQMIAEIQKLQMQKAQAEMADHAEQRKIQAAQLIEAQRQQELFRNAGQVPLNMQGTGQANAMLPEELRIGAQAELQKPGQIDYNALRQKGMSPALMEQLAKIQTLGLPEVARTIKSMQNGREVEQQFDKFGRPVGSGMEQYKAPISVRRGDREDLVDPFTMQPRASFGINQSPDSKASNAVTIRGQDKADARARESTSMLMSKPFEITGEDGKPVLVQQDKQGNIRPVTGYLPKQGASKPLTDSQAKALLFGSRMQESASVIDQLASEGRTKSIPGSRTSIIGPAITAMSDEKNQKLEQAKRDFINATLRRESGAVITPDEFNNGEKQYFPQIGDSPGVIAQKKRNREIATRGILAEVPDSENRVLKVRNSGASPSIDSLLEKYK